IGGGDVLGDGESRSPSLTPDGRFVAFTSFADDLLDGSDANGVMDAFVRDRSVVVPPAAAWSHYGAGFPGTYRGPRLLATSGPGPRRGGGAGPRPAGRDRSRQLPRRVADRLPARRPGRGVDPDALRRDAPRRPRLGRAARRPAVGRLALRGAAARSGAPRRRP